MKQKIIDFARQRGADLVGFVSTDHLNQVIPTQFTPERLWPRARTAISIAKRLLRSAAEIGTTDSIQNARWVAWRTNEFLNRRAMELGHFIEQHGAMALPLSNGTMVDPDWTNQGIFGELSHRHVAAEAGLGVIGVPTYCITPLFGPRQYFITVLTELELEPDPRLTDFDPCTSCAAPCVDACPAEAIERGRRTIKKRKCMPYAMPHGLLTAQDYVERVLSCEDPESRNQALHDFDFGRLHRATVYGVGHIAGCFHCLAACPVGKTDGEL